MATWNITSGTNVATVYAGGAAGDTYNFLAGAHRITAPIAVRNNDILQCAIPLEAWITGAVVLSTWAVAGARWSKSGQSYTQEANSELFFSNMVGAKVRVTTLGACVAGTWYFDTAANIIYVGDDPTSVTVELSITQYLINSSATGVTLRNLIFEKATPTYQQAMVDRVPRDDGLWIIEDCEFRYSNSTGLDVRLAAGGRISRCHIHHNQQMNLTGGNSYDQVAPGSPILVEYCELSYGRYGARAEYDVGSEGGCTKFVTTNDLTVRRCWVHHNDGPGIWLDIHNYDYIIEENLVEDNTWMGIFQEIGQGGIIRNNVVRRCATALNPAEVFDVMHAGILVGASHDVEIYGNTVEDCPKGIVGFTQWRREYQPDPGHPDHNPNHWDNNPPGEDPTYGGLPGGGNPVPYLEGDHRTYNLHVHDNICARAAGMRIGVVDDTVGGDPTHFDLSRTNVQNNAFQYSNGRYGSNRFVNNDYYISNGLASNTVFYWSGGGSWSNWFGIGQDAGGTMNAYAAYIPSQWVLPPGWDDPLVTVLVTDNFNRANATGLGSNWTDVDGGWDILGNQAVSRASGLDNWSVYTGLDWTGGPNQISRVTMIAEGVSDGGPGVRMSSVNETGYIFSVRGLGGSTTHQIQWANAGAYNVIASFTATIVTGDEVEIEHTGTLLIARVNGTDVGSVAHTSVSSGNPGLYGWHNEMVVEDFEAASAATGALGSLAKTLGTLTVASVGVVGVAGASAQTLGALTVASAGTVGGSAGLAVTLGAVTLSATAQTAVDGVLAQTLGTLTLAATSAADAVGTLAQTLGVLTLSGSGVITTGMTLPVLPVRLRVDMLQGVITGGAFAASVSDNFNRADAGDLGSNWSNYNGLWKIVGNQAVGTIPAWMNVSIYIAEDWIGSPNQRASVTMISMGGIGDAGPGVRMDTLSETGYYLSIRGLNGSATHQIQRAVNGAYNVIHSFTATVNTGDQVTLEHTGTHLIALLNDVDMSSGGVADTTIPDGNPGLFGYHNDVVVDNFQAEPSQGVWTDITSDTQTIEGLSIRYGIQGGGPLDLLAESGTCSFALRSHTLPGLYAPSHANCLDGWGLNTIIRVVFIDAAFEEYVKFVGRVQMIDPDPGVMGPQRVHVMAHDFMHDLTDSVTRTIPAQMGQTDAALIALLYDNLPVSRYPPMGVDIDEDVETFPVAFTDTSGGVSTRALLSDVLTSGFWIGYQRGDGVHVFKNRLTRTFDASVDSFTQADMLAPDGLAMPSDEQTVYKRVIVETPQITLGTSAVVLASAEGDDTSPLAVAEIREVWMAYRDPNDTSTSPAPIGGYDFHLSPVVAGTDYVFNSQADGLGTNLTAFVTVLAEPFSGDVKFTLTNTHLTLPAYRITLRQRGKPIRRLTPLMFASGEDGQKTLRVATAFQPSQALAQLMAEYIKGQYEVSTQRPTAMEIIPGQSDRLMRHALEREPGDRITISEPVTGAACDAIIHSIDISCAPGLNATVLVSCRWGLGPQSSYNFIVPWRLGTVGRGELGEVTVLG